MEQLFLTVYTHYLFYCEEMGDTEKKRCMNLFLGTIWKIASPKRNHTKIETHSGIEETKRLNEKHLLSLTYTTIFISHTLNTDTYRAVVRQKNNVLCARSEYYFSASIWNESTSANRQVAAGAACSHIYIYPGVEVSKQAKQAEKKIEFMAHRMH